VKEKSRARMRQSSLDDRAGATFSADHLYRYTLWRRWAPSGSGVDNGLVFAGLNASTADESKNDPTVRKWIGFGTQWGFGGMTAINMFGWRSTDPHVLKLVGDPVGPENDAAIVRVVSSASRVVLCWGTHRFLGELLTERAARVERLIREHARCEVGHLGRCADGQPKHVLMLSYSTAFAVT
jgi:hypothetical protein